MASDSANLRTILAKLDLIHELLKDRIDFQLTTIEERLKAQGETLRRLSPPATR